MAGPPEIIYHSPSREVGDAPALLILAMPLAAYFDRERWRGCFRLWGSFLGFPEEIER